MNNYIIPDNFDDLIISNKEEIVNFYKNCINENNFNMIISGPSGTCKTTLINIIINNFINNNPDIPKNNILLKINYYDDINLQDDTNIITIFCQNNTNCTKLIYIDNFDEYSETSQQIIKIMMDNYNLFKKNNKIYFIFEANNINKIKDIIRTRTNICNISEFSSNELSKIFKVCLKQDNITYDEDCVKFVKNKTGINTYTILSLITKLKLLNLKKIDLNTLRNHYDIIDINIFFTFFDNIEKNLIDKAIDILYNLYDYGYDIGDIYFYIFKYIKKNKIEKYYKLCDVICLYISEMYNGNYDKIMLVLFSYDIKLLIIK